MLTSKGVDLDDINILPHSFDVNDLINKKTDLMLAYTTNEPFLLKEKGYKTKIFNPKDYGFDFYEELIFTRSELVNKDPKLVSDFYQATIKGWEYAFNNINEVAKLIYEKYNPQNKSLESLIFEANEMKKLVYDEKGRIGTITPERINLIINTYKVMGLLDKDIKFNELVYSNHLNNLNLTNSELIYLKQKKKIKLCIDPMWMPFESFKKGKHIGITADYFKLLEKKLAIPIEPIVTKSWSESLKLGQNRECDAFSLVMSTPKREKYLDFTKPYLHIPLVIATDINQPFIDKLEQVKDKRLAIVKGYAYGEILKIKYPTINFIEVENITEGLEKVLNGNAFGFIGTIATVGFHIQKDYIGQLKITAKLNDTWNLGIGTRNDEPLLNSIFSKAIDSINDNELQKILNKWISVNFNKEFDYRILYILIIFSFLSFLFYRQYLLKRLNNELNKKVALEIQKNEEKNKILIKQSRMASMGEMLENIAHQWRQPLSVISVAASGLELKKELNTLSDEEFKEAILHIKNSTQYLSDTIDDFRTYFNENKEKKSINIHNMINKCIDLLGSKIINYNIVFIKNIDKNLEIISLENELIQSIMNILINAKDALLLKEKDKYILINVFKDKDNLVIEIIDSANGIKKEILDKIFEPYFTTKHQYKGTGIGLYMTKQLIENHLKGSIKATNESFTFENKQLYGAKFTLEIPI